MQDFLNNQRGNIAMIAGVAMPLLLMAGGMAVDYGRAHSAKASLQSAGDAAAIGGAKELMLSNADASQVSAAVKSIVDAHISGSNSTQRAVRAEAKVIKNGTAVEVTLQERQKNVFGGFLNPAYTDIAVASVAEFSGGTNVCVIGLDETQTDTVAMDSQAKLLAPNCATYSNSDSITGLGVGGTAYLEASLICSAGGYVGSSSNYSASPITDCPRISDPLANRPPPAFGACDETDLKVTRNEITLTPGVYCGGIQVARDGVVHFEPGEYIIKDGALRVTANGRIDGKNVGFYLTGGTDAVFSFAAFSYVNLTAPKEGALAGLIFFEDRNNPVGNQHTIVSEHAQVLLGTIYLSKGTFLVSSKTKVAENSAYTAVIARKIKLTQSPTLVLNTDYGLTDIPVPNGLASSGGQIRLTN